MGKDTKQRSIGKFVQQRDLPAGDFSSWLRDIRNAFILESGTEVDCGECIACCSSSQFIHVNPREMLTLGLIRKEMLVAAPGYPKGHVLLGYDRNGYCPMMINEKCSIYEHRPLTCRSYDCRVFVAAGISAGDNAPRITERIKRWKFTYPTEHDHDEHGAVRAAANFIAIHAACFPGGKTPALPTQLAVLAIKVYDVFLDRKGEKRNTSSDAAIAGAIVETCRKFDARRPA